MQERSFRVFVVISSIEVDNIKTITICVDVMINDKVIMLYSLTWEKINKEMHTNNFSCVVTVDHWWDILWFYNRTSFVLCVCWDPKRKEEKDIQWEILCTRIYLKFTAGNRGNLQFWNIKNNENIKKERITKRAENSSDNT